MPSISPLEVAVLPFLLLLGGIWRTARVIRLTGRRRDTERIQDFEAQV